MGYYVLLFANYDQLTNFYFKSIIVVFREITYCFKILNTTFFKIEPNERVTSAIILYILTF